jgi:hypothetical protein
MHWLSFHMDSMVTVVYTFDLFVSVEHLLRIA